MDMHQLVEGYLRSSTIAGKSSATLTWYQRRLGSFVAYLVSHKHSMKVKDLTLADGEGYVLSLMQQSHKWQHHPNQKPVAAKLSSFTIIGHVRAIRALSNWALDNSLLTLDPFRTLPIPKAPKLLLDVLTDDEITRVMACADSLSSRGVRMRVLLLVALDTAVRADELISLRLERIDLERGTIKVLGKGSKERIIPLGQAALKEIVAYVQFHRPTPANDKIGNVFLTEDGNPLTYTGLSAIIRRIRIKTGIKKLHLHMFRHTSITMMIQRGMNAFAVQQFAGHSSIKTTEMYVHLLQHLTASDYRPYSVVDGLAMIQSLHKRGPKPKAVNSRQR
jgi:site-specific recombinase XerD